ncbi:MAG: cytochrome C oxidase subunit IV family protein [Candidatus Hydrogenedentes bacterium]|nr:cytochrome C oxidase subunit IV family protein [Candidatus Hydrogenedentota bacterium]
MAREHADTTKKHVRAYIAVFVALLVLTVLTVAASSLTTGVAASIVIALTIAAVKGSLVGSFFMHLAWEKRAIYALLLVAGAFLIAMMGLFLWSLNSPLAGTGIAPMQPAITHEQATEGH